MNNKDSADQYRMLRGGSFFNLRDDVRCAARLRYVPYYRRYYFGFRVVLSPVSKVLRGGAFYDDLDFVLCAGRYRYAPHRRHFDFGFRVVLSPVSEGVKS